MGLAGIALAFAVFWAGVSLPAPFAVHMAALVLGVILLDVGAQLAQVSNQTRIFGLVPSARSRLNTVYMTIYFSGAAVGSAMSTVVWAHWRWNGVCALALGFIGLARLRHAAGVKGREPFNPDSRGEHPLEEAVLEA
jgi:MFS family permease